MTYKLRTESKEDLREFVKSIPNLREDFHEGSDFLNAQVIGGYVLDNEGFNYEMKIRIIDKKNADHYTEVNLATLLGMAMGYYE